MRKSPPAVSSAGSDSSEQFEIAKEELSLFLKEVTAIAIESNQSKSTMVNLLMTMALSLSSEEKYKYSLQQKAFAQAPSRNKIARTIHALFHADMAELSALARSSSKFSPETLEIFDTELEDAQKQTIRNLCFYETVKNIANFIPLLSKTEKDLFDRQFSGFLEAYQANDFTTLKNKIIKTPAELEITSISESASSTSASPTSKTSDHSSSSASGSEERTKTPPPITSAASAKPAQVGEKRERPWN